LAVAFGETQQSMKKMIIIIGLAFGLISCVQTKYVVKTDTALSNMDLDKNITIYIQLWIANWHLSVILNSTYSLLEMGKI